MDSLITPPSASNIRLTPYDQAVGPTRLPRSADPWAAWFHFQLLHLPHTLASPDYAPVVLRLSSKEGSRDPLGYPSRPPTFCSCTATFIPVVNPSRLTVDAGASLVAQLRKNPPACGRPGFDPSLGQCPGEGKGSPLQYSGLKNPTECTVNGVTESDTTEQLHSH